ncbi:TetR-like C-terminal domain-containing protein [Amycolatopsis minnesotensis]|uniref:TetR/AcrR family transcriptional regulator n=1 Tax=Amycolatopsis minnesotensis TaxID=337894 RepID=A0ABN2RSP7_9PSEU
MAESGRGRPRSERSRLAVLSATADLLIEGGLAAATVEAIAARAGVGKATIYKWWPSRGHVALESFFTRHAATATIVDRHESLADGLTAQLDALLDLMRNPPDAALLREIVALAQTDDELRAAFTEHWLRPRRTAVERVLRAAVERGEVRPDTDIAVTMDQLFGPLYYRLLMGHAPLDESLTAALLKQTLRAITR